MSAFILDHEPALRLAFFLGVLAMMIGWEQTRPRRRLATTHGARWCVNLGIVVIDALLLRLLLPVAAVGMALVAEERGMGLFNAIPAPAWLAVLVSIIVLDLAIYAQHVAFHKVPLLWRLHRMHHTDIDIDATTGVRFHPVEIVLSMLFKMGLVIALGAPAVAVVVFEILLNATAMFNHGNVRLPPLADRLIRSVVVTPDMHRVHHSVHRDETDSNYGFNLSVWDRLFGTYRPEPRDGHESMTIGLAAFREPAEQRLHRLLVQPFLPS